MQLNKDKLITEKQKKEGLNTDSIPIHSPNPLPLNENETVAPPPERTGSRKETAYQIYRDLILENIEYDTLTQNPRIDREQLDEIVDIRWKPSAPTASPSGWPGTITRQSWSRPSS